MPKIGDPDYQIIDRHETDFCQQCKFVEFYDWYFCNNPEHPWNMMVVDIPYIHVKDTAKDCVLFQRAEEDD